MGNNLQSSIIPNTKKRKITQILQSRMDISKWWHGYIIGGILDTTQDICFTTQ